MAVTDIIEEPDKNAIPFDDTKSLLRKAIEQAAQERKLTKHNDNAANIVSAKIDTNRDIIISKSGIYMSEVNSKGVKVQKALSLIPIYPVEKLEPYDENRPFLVLEAIKGNGEIFRTIIPLSALASPNQNREYLKELNNAGFSLSEKIPGTQYTLAKILLDVSIILEREGNLPIKRGAIKSGWHFPEEIENSNISITQPIHIIPGGANYVGTMPAIHEVKGNAEEWKTIIQDAIKGSPGIISILSAAISSYMRGWIDIETKVFHFHGPSSLGKTLSMRMAASLTGSPSKGYLVNSWNASKAGFEALAEGISHGFLCLDEAHTMLNNAKNPLDLLMGFANNEGGLRGKVTGNLREKKNWNLNILSTGNTDLTHISEGTAQDEALKVRVIEIDISKHNIFSWSDSLRAETIESELNKHFGHGYHLIIDAITQNHIRYKEIYSEFSKAISEASKHLNESVNVINRRAKAWGLMYVGLHILDDILDISEDDINLTSELIYKLASEEIIDAGEMESEIDEDIINEVRSFVMRNLLYFHVKGYWFNEYSNNNDDDLNISSLQTDKAKYLSSNCKSMLGIIEQNEVMNEAGEITGKVYISTTAGKHIKECPDLADLAMRADKAGILVKQAGQGARRVIKKKGLGNAYAFDLSKVPF